MHFLTLHGPGRAAEPAPLEAASRAGHVHAASVVFSGRPALRALARAGADRAQAGQRVRRGRACGRWRENGGGWAEVSGGHCKQKRERESAKSKLLFHKCTAQKRAKLTPRHPPGPRKSARLRYTVPSPLAQHSLTSKVGPSTTQLANCAAANDCTAQGTRKTKEKGSAWVLKNSRMHTGMRQR